MSEAYRIAAKLNDGTDLAAAALLLALAESEVDVPKEDTHLLAQLEREGCIKDGRVTPLGYRVAIRLARDAGAKE